MKFGRLDQSAYSFAKDHQALREAFEACRVFDCR